MPPPRTPTPSQTRERRSRARSQRTSAQATSTVVRANGRSTPSRCPNPEHQWIEQPEQRRDHARPEAEQERRQGIEREGERATLEQRHQS